MDLTVSKTHSECDTPKRYVSFGAKTLDTVSTSSSVDVPQEKVEFKMPKLKFKAMS